MANKTDWRQIFDLKHPSLKPLWVRLALIVACIGWAVVELTIGSHLWAGSFGVIALYLAYVFFLSPDRTYFNSADTEEKDK